MDLNLDTSARLDLSELQADDIAPLERMFEPLTPDTWKDFACSHYLTLLAVFGDKLTRDELAQLAMALAHGIAADLGGSQPYITSGSQLMASARARKVIELRQRGVDYREVAKQCGNITERQVRQIENEWVREQRASRQGNLELG